MCDTSGPNTGAIISLNAIGKQDTYLLEEDPDHSFFKYNVKKHIRMKSSLKFCVIAAGEFDLYAAEPRACEWDIAAGHALLIHAGGEVTDFNGNEILYGKPEFKNPSLILRNKNIL